MEWLCGIAACRILFVATHVAALGWVSISYLIAVYATVRLGQVFPVVELSEDNFVLHFVLHITEKRGKNGLKQG